MTQSLFIVSAFLWVIALIASVPGFEPEPLWRLGCVTALFVSAFLILSQSKTMLRGWLVGVAVLFCLNAAASILWSDIPFVSVIAFCTFALFPLGFFAYAQSGIPVRFYHVCAIGAGCVIAALALWALIQFFFLPELLVNGQPRMPFADPNSYAMVLLLGFFPACGLMLSGQNRLVRNAGLLLAIVTLLGVLIISGRGVVLSLIIGLGLFLFLTRAHISQHKRCWLVLLGSAVLCLTIAAFFYKIATTPQERLADAFIESGLFFGSRLAIWDGVLAMATDHLPFGTGIGTFFLYYPEYRVDADIHSAGIMAHSDPLQFMTEMGILAPVLFYIFAGLAVLRMISYLKQAGPPQSCRIMPSALFCALGALIFHTHFSFDFYIPPLLLLSGFMLGWWYRQTAPDQEKVTIIPDGVVRAIWQGGLVCALVCSLFFLQGFLRSIHDTDRADYLLQIGDLDGFSHAVNNADATGLGWNARAYILAAGIPLGILEADNGHLSQQEREQLDEQAGSLLEKAETHNPRLASIWYHRALLAEMQDDARGAIGFLEQAVRLNPLYLPPRMMLAGLYEAGQRHDDALRVLKDGLHWPYKQDSLPYKQDSLPYYTRTAFLAGGLGDKETHQKAQEKMAALLRRRGYDSSDPVITDSGAGGL